MNRENKGLSFIGFCGDKNFKLNIKDWPYLLDNADDRAAFRESCGGYQGITEIKLIEFLESNDYSPKLIEQLKIIWKNV